VLARQRVVDLGFLVVILELGKVDNLVFARVFGFAIDLEHHFIRLEQHSFERITIPSQQEGAWLKRNGTSGSNSVVESQRSESTVNLRHEDLAFAFRNGRRSTTPLVLLEPIGNTIDVTGPWFGGDMGGLSRFL
jgi:hypothetical protein